MAVGGTGGAGHHQQGAGLSSGQQRDTVLLRFNGIIQPADPGAFDNLPKAIIPCLFTHLSGADLARFSCVSREWKQSGKTEKQKRINAFPKAINEDTRSVEEMMKEPTPEQQKCLDALKDLNPNDIGQAIQTLRPKINEKTDNIDIYPMLQTAATIKIDDVLLALILGPDVDKFDHLGLTPSYKAAFDGHTEIVKILLGAGADVNKVNALGVTPLFGAVGNGHTETVKTLLKAGATVDQVNSAGDTPLFSAAHNGHTKIVEALLAEGADVNHVGFHENSALYWAAYEGHIETVQVLLDAGSGVNKTNITGDSPLLAAFRNGHAEIEGMLKERGARWRIVV